jgi:DHA1 family tetracycline resistance protein-like MFS transporter
MVLYVLSFSLTIPALPGLLLEIVNNDAEKSSYYYGAATSMRYGLEFFFQPMIGTFADISGRKSILCLSFLTVAGEFLLLAFFPGLTMFFCARAFSGLGDAGITSTYTIVTDIATYNGDIVTQKYGLIGAMAGLGFIVGPVGGGFLCSVSFKLCLLVAAGAAIISTFVCIVFLEETGNFRTELATSEDAVNYSPVDCTERVKSAESSSSHAGKDKAASSTAQQQPRPAFTCSAIFDAFLASLRLIRLHLSNRRMLHFTVVLILTNVAGGYYFVWYIYMDYQFGSSPADIGIYLSFLGVIAAVVLGVVIHWMVPSIWSETNAAFYGMMLSGGHNLCLALCNKEWQLYVLTVIFALESVYSPALRAVIVRESLQRPDSKELQGGLQGILSSLSTLATAVSSLLFSAIFSVGIHELHSTWLIFIVSGGMYALAALYFYVLIMDGSLRGHNDRAGDADDDVGETDSRYAHGHEDGDGDLYERLVPDGDSDRGGYASREGEGEGEGASNGVRAISKEVVNPLRRPSMLNLA